MNSKYTVFEVIRLRVLPTRCYDSIIRLNILKYFIFTFAFQFVSIFNSGDCSDT